MNKEKLKVRWKVVEIGSKDMKKRGKIRGIYIIGLFFWMKLILSGIFKKRQ